MNPIQQQIQAGDTERTDSIAMRPGSFDLFGISINSSSMQESVAWVLREAFRHRKSTAHFVNADCLNHAYKNKEYRRSLRDAKRVFADGSGIKLAANILEVTAGENINGTDMFPLICERSVQTNASLFMLGAKPDVARVAAENMQQRYPGLRIAGTRDGYFSREETASVIDEINKSGANIVLVAMGAPRQETWLSKYRHQINAGICLGVGGLFDYYSGNIPRAPDWMRRMGLEWIWRFMQEPGRMWKRYWIGNFVFIYRVMKQKADITQPAARLDTGRINTNLVALHKAPIVKQKQVVTGIRRGLRARLVKARWRSNNFLNRTIDVMASGGLILLLSPLLLMLSLMIKLESRGPVFFSQMRVGEGGQHFRMWKFRSMYTDAEERKSDLSDNESMSGGVRFKMKKDPRITRIGAVIRRLSIDELPQLWNVLIGDMSLVGPRPGLPSEVAEYNQADRKRLLGKPGITCIWQVSGRSDIPFDQQVEMDVRYIAERSFFTNIKLIFKTIPAVISGRGAY